MSKKYKPDYLHFSHNCRLLTRVFTNHDNTHTLATLTVCCIDFIVVFSVMTSFLAQMQKTNCWQLLPTIFLNAFSKERN